MSIQKGPPPTNAIQQQFIEALAPVHEQINRLHSRRGKILTSITKIRKIQQGNNDTADLRRFRSLTYDEYMIYDPKTKKEKNPQLRPKDIDLSGWLERSPEIDEQFDIIDAALSYAPDVMISYVEGITKASESAKPAQIIAPSDVDEPVTIQHQTKATGMLGWLSKKVGKFSVTYKQEFEYPFSDVLKQWARYKSYYKFFKERCTRLHPSALADSIIIQDEMLEVVKLAVQAIGDKGTRIELNENRLVLADVAKGMMAAATLAQQGNIMGGGNGVPFSNQTKPGGQ